MKKHFLLFVVLIFSILCRTIPLYSTEPALIGDADSNGTVDIIDALVIARYFVGLDPGLINMNTTDVNYDGITDIVDALMVARKYVGMLTDFPADQVYAQLTAQLDAARAKYPWSLQTYAYDCLIPLPENNAQLAVIVKVQNDAVAAVVERNTGIPLPAVDLSSFFTINQLFAFFREAIDRKLLGKNSAAYQGMSSALQINFYTAEIHTYPPGGLPVLLIYIPYQFKNYWYSIF